METVWPARWKNFIAATVDMAPPLALPKIGNLGLRVLSALVMLPLAIAAAWVGGIIFAVMLSVAAAAMCWELTTLCGEKWSPVTIVSMCTAVAAPMLEATMGFDAAAIAVVAGTLAVLIYCLLRRSANLPILVLGIPVYRAGHCRCRLAARYARYRAFNGAVARGRSRRNRCGRLFQRPRDRRSEARPVISPNKTWSGLAGGAMLAGCVGLFVGVASGDANARARDGGEYRSCGGRTNGRLAGIRG